MLCVIIDLVSLYPEMMGKDDGAIVKKVDTKYQIANIFTKGLAIQLFEALREMIMGW